LIGSSHLVAFLSFTAAACWAHVMYNNMIDGRHIATGSLDARISVLAPKVKRLKVKGLDVCIRHLHEHAQQRFTITIRSGVLTGNDTRWWSAISGSPLPK